MTLTDPEYQQVLATMRQTSAAVEAHGEELQTLTAYVSDLRRRVYALEGRGRQTRRVDAVGRNANQACTG